MGANHPIVKIGDVASSISVTHKLNKDQLIFLNTSDVLHGKILHRNYTIVKYWPGQAKKSIRTNDILYSEIRPANGRWAYVAEPADDFVVSTKLMVIRSKEDLIYPKYLYQFLTNNETAKWLQHLAESRSGTFPQITFDQVAALEIPLPPITEQRKIADILGTLDDKIELNRRINATLEDMARTLFKSWFVDFDPVRAKMEGRQPEGMDAETAALFPDGFEDSELGEVPRGWRVSELGHIAEVIDCLHAKKPERCDVGGIFLQLNNIHDNGLIDTDDAYLINEIEYKKWISRMEAKEGDCVITNVGRVGAVAQIPSGVKAALGRNITGVRCRVEFSFPTFLIECLLSEAMRDEIRQKTDTGTILDALNVKSIPRLRFVRPSNEIAQHFETLVRPLRERMEQNLSQSRTLATLRDTLLPKLMGGEIGV